MAESYPTKDDAPPPKYEPPALNSHQKWVPSTSMRHSSLLEQEEARGAISASAAQATGQPMSVQPDQAQPTSASPPRAGNSSIYPCPDNEVILTSSLPRKSLVHAYILGITLGPLGAHHFYLGRGGFGTVYLFTFGLFGVGWIVDWFRMPSLVKNANRLILDPKFRDKKTIADAYVLWFPGGLVGEYMHRVKPSRCRDAS